MRNCSLSELDLLEGPPWSVMRPEAKLVYMVHADAPGHGEAHDPCGCSQSVPPTVAMMVSSVVWAVSEHLVWSCVPTAAGAVLTICVVPRNHVEAADGYEEQGNHSCSDFNDCRHTVGKDGHGQSLLSPQHPPPHTQ